ncbi:beta-xylosidase [Deinococcus peraridilitoris DSM 19664]|uniref:Beta-xylosidase n=2 Tax=Deinococcus TaxID=1298 RepID=K9ZZ51_DEIPD|nr:beta-xylosidase [Deinococcus peraridilitoris DSM 19664]
MPVESALTSYSENVPLSTFANPVIAEDFADPFILRQGLLYYAYSTAFGGEELPTRRSYDLLNWTNLGDTMGPLPVWAERGFTWAPDIMAVEDGFMLYYTARHRASEQQVIGAAFSTSPEGPFLDTSETPFISQHELGGVIDAHAFIDRDGQRYLYWKNDGNSCGLRTFIWVQRLSDDGRQLVGERVALIGNDQHWEGNLIEAPFVHARDGQYFLFYSAAHYGDETYGVGYAVGSSPMGPFQKVQDGPLLSTFGEVAGPGGQGILSDEAGNTWMYYHAWTKGQVGYEAGGARSLRCEPLWWNQGHPVLESSAFLPLPAPPSENEMPALSLA